MALPTTGLVQHLRSDLGLTQAAGRVSAWADQSAAGQDVAQSNATDRPYLLGGAIDGFPLLTFGLAGAANKFLTTAGNFTDRAAVDMPGSHARTVMVVTRPAFDGAFGVTGGKAWSIDNSWCAMFELRGDFVTDGAYAWERFIDDYSNALQFTPVTGGAGGPFDGVPTLAEWRTSGGTNFSFLVNGLIFPVTPSVLYGSGTGVGPARVSVNAIGYHGGIAEVAVWDYDLSTNPAAHAAAMAYFAATYASLSLPAANGPVISPRRVISIPGGAVPFSATGGGGGNVFAFAPGGNRSGASIDPTSGAYQAGARGPAEDLITVTDAASLSDEAQVSVTGTLYRDYQSKTPAGPQGPILRVIERVFGSEKDVQFERARQAALVGLPTVGPPDQLDSIGEDRLLPRAAIESPADDGGSHDAAFGERLRTSPWTGEEGWRVGGGHEGLLRELSRSGFPSGGFGPSAYIIQRTKLVSWLESDGVHFIDHTGWTFDGHPVATWHQFGLLFGGDFTAPGGGTLQDGDPSADLLNRIVKLWKPPKARYMGAWVVVSGPTWGWPIGVAWGDGGRDWGGGSTRYVSPG